MIGRAVAIMSGLVIWGGHPNDVLCLVKVSNRSFAQTESECDDCGKRFLLLSNLKRHQREKHFDIKFNIDFYEGHDPPRNFECEQYVEKLRGWSS